VSGRFPDGSEPNSFELAQNQDIMRATLPAEPQPEPEPEEEGYNGSPRLVVLLFILAVGYLASAGELDVVLDPMQPYLELAKPYLEPLLAVVANNGSPAETVAPAETETVEGGL
jgi:hypothetical protein